jgi:hypothetical protein
MTGTVDENSIVSRHASRVLSSYCLHHMRKIISSPFFAACHGKHDYNISSLELPLAEVGFRSGIECKSSRLSQAICLEVLASHPMELKVGEEILNNWPQIWTQPYYLEAVQRTALLYGYKIDLFFKDLNSSSGTNFME